MNIKTENIKTIPTNRELILLGHVPYWDPLVPPQGLGCIKQFLGQYGYQVDIVDLNVVEEFKVLYNNYFNAFKNYVPGGRRGNFFNIGHDVLQNHMMAYINHKDEREYLELVKQLIDSIFFSNVKANQVQEQNRIIEEFYVKLEIYFRGLLEDKHPAILGLTAYKATLSSVMFIFRLAKKINPRITTVMGGGIFADTMEMGSPNFKFFLEKTEGYIDKIMIGRGELFLLKLLRHELPENQRVFTLSDIIADSSEPYFTDIPDFSDLNIAVYPYLVASGSSGCPFKCSFCNTSLFYGKYQQKEPAQTVHEMEQIYNTYGKRMFFMTDALLNPLITDLAKELLKSDTSLYFDGYFRVDDASINVENTLLWRRAGFYRARLGVESGSQRILDLMGKRITIDQTKAALAGLAHAGIKTTAYFVIGHPGETQQDFQQTLYFLEEIQNNIWQAECVPFAFYYTGQPGSGQWADKRALLYPESAKNMLITQTWIVKGNPPREEVYERVFAFAQHCKKLGIPNPYTLNEIYNADARWKKLHRNAVPSLIELMNSQDNHLMDESRNVNKLNFAQNKQHYNGGFDFYIDIF